MSEATPRVNASYLERFANQTVRLTGTVVQVRGEQATIDAGGMINLQLNRDSHVQVNTAVEVVGKVMSDLSVRVLMITDVRTNNLDMKAVEAVVDATHRFKEIFYES